MPLLQAQGRINHMLSRREFIQAIAALTAITGGTIPTTLLAGSNKLSQNHLLDMAPFGNVTIAHLTDLHAQLMPSWYREPSINIGVGEAEGKPPHLTGSDFLNHFNIAPNSPDAYALSSENFVTLANQYGRMGGMDRIATIIKHIRANRPDNTLFLDGGDTWHGSYTTLKTKAADMVEIMNHLKPDAMTGHWEFTLGEQRVEELVKSLPFPFLAANIFNTEWDEPAFDPMKMFERGGVKIAVIGQAFPYTPIANPRWMMPNWSFGIREEEIQKQVTKAKSSGAKLIVLLSHNGFDVDSKLASRVEGIDIILSGHTHDALPRPVQISKTLIIASGSNGKFLSRLDLDVDQKSGLKDYRFRLIPVFSDVIEQDTEMKNLIKKIRAPHEKELSRTIGQTDSLLYRRGNFNGTIDDLICQSLSEQHDAEIALSPGFRWGPSLLPGQSITIEDIYNVCAITYPATYRTTMSGQQLKNIFEDVADNLFNKDPYYQQGGDMVRVSGLGLNINPNKTIGNRITNLTHLKSNTPLDLNKNYTVAGWASVNEATNNDPKAIPIWDAIENYTKNHSPLKVSPNDNIKLIEK